MKQAIAILKGKINGTVHFEQIEKEKVRITYDIKGLSDGKHGFHVHTHGNLSNNCNMVCSHFNPDGNKHGGLRSKERHSGDLGNIVSKNSVCNGTKTARKLSLSQDKYNILGRMIVIHADEDDVGRGTGTKKEESLKTGNAGKKIACAVIGFLN